MITPSDKSITIISSHKGHIPKMGKSAGKELNKYWLIRDNKTNKKCYLMECHNNNYFKFSKKDLQKSLDVGGILPTWYIAKNGYVYTHTQRRYFHQHIMNHYGNGQGQSSIDHKNMDKLDNRRSNLRISTQTEQNMNQSKRTRTKTIPNLSLPIDEIPSLIHYIPSKGNHGELFEVSIIYYVNDIRERIRKKTTKSSDKSIEYKLIQAIKIRHQLIKENQTILSRNIDGKEWTSIDELWKHCENNIIKKLLRQSVIPNNSDTFNPDLTDFPDKPSIKTNISSTSTSTSSNYKEKERLRNQKRTQDAKGKKEECKYCQKSIAINTLTRHYKNFCHKSPYFDDKKFIEKKELADKKKSDTMKNKHRPVLSNDDIEIIKHCYYELKKPICVIAKSYKTNNCHINEILKI